MRPAPRWDASLRLVAAAVAAAAATFAATAFARAPGGQAVAEDAADPAASSAAAPAAAPWAADASPSCEASAAGELEARVNRIVHGASTLAALMDGGLAQVPGAGPVLVSSVQVSMVCSIGYLYGCHIDMAHGLAAVAGLAGQHVKKSILKEMVGFIPFAGNLVKTSLTFFMTEGIGYTASRLLRCGGSDGLMDSASPLEGAAAGGGAERQWEAVPRHIFHLISDRLASGLRAEDTEEVWQTVKLLFSAQGQAELLEKVRTAATHEELAALARRHAWNLEVVGEVLRMLQDGFAKPEACIMVDFVADKYWAAASADADARLLVAPYLQLCMSRAQHATLQDVAQAAARLLVDTKYGTRFGVSPLLIRRTAQLLEGAVEEALAADAGTRPGTNATDFLEPLLPPRELPTVLETTFMALALGEGAACGLLRGLMRLQRRHQASSSSASSWPSVRNLMKLDGLAAAMPEGTEICLPALRADFAQRLLFQSPPLGTEWPSEASLRKNNGAAAALAASSGRAADLEAVLKETVVGQQCALARITDHPGYVRARLRGRWHKDAPLVLLLTGPSGVGKTLLARTLAEVLLGRSVGELEASGRFKTFHMNTYNLEHDQKNLFGPPKGTIGTGDLPELLKAAPDAVVLLDEVEKAHPSFARAFLKVFGEHGAVYDPRTGRDVPTARATFILTSNLGKDLIKSYAAAAAYLQGESRLQATQEGRESGEDGECEAYGHLRDDVVAAMGRPHVLGQEHFFRESEIRGRLTDVLPFLYFGPEEVEEAVRRFLTDEARIFARDPAFAHATLAWEPSVVPYLAAEYGRRPDEGLRRVQKQMQASVRQVVGDAIEAGLLQKYAGVVLRLDPLDGTSGRLDLRVLAPSSVSKSAPKASAPANGRSEGPSSGMWGAWSTMLMPSVPQSTAASTEARTRPTAVGGSWGAASGAPGVPGAEWEFRHDWDWEFMWQQLWEFLWEWRVALCATVAVTVVAAMAPLVVPSMGSAAVSSAASAAAAGAATAAPAAVGATPAAAAANVMGVAAASWVPTLLQILAGALPVAVPLVTAGYAWHHRHKLATILWIAMVLMAFPTVFRTWVWSRSAVRTRSRAACCSTLEFVKPTRNSRRKGSGTSTGLGRRRTPAPPLAQSAQSVSTASDADRVLHRTQKGLAPRMRRGASADDVACKKPFSDTFDDGRPQMRRGAYADAVACKNPFSETFVGERLAGGTHGDERRKTKPSRLYEDDDGREADDEPLDEVYESSEPDA